MTTTSAPPTIPTVRMSPDNPTVLANLGLLAELAGTWRGGGFNLVARPDFQDQSNVFLELNLTTESLAFTPISSAIPNRGFLQNDIELFGLTYLQQISDATTGSALHIEPGIWVNQPATTAPPVDPPPGGQLVARMANIPHGNSLVAQGFALPFFGPPVISPGSDPINGGNPAFSSFPSFNSTPFTPAFPDSPNTTPPKAAIFAAGTSEAQSKVNAGFHEYTLSFAPSPQNTRTPQGNFPPVLPPSITQQLVNDPITLLQQTIEQQIADGYQFEGVALNISTASVIPFVPEPVISPNPAPPAVPLRVPQFGGDIANLAFLLGTSTGNENAGTSLVYATFWLEKLTHPDGRPPLMQLQYAQMTLLNFPARTFTANFSWPHITVSTLQRTFG